MMDEYNESSPDPIADRTYALAKLVEAMKGVEKGSPILSLVQEHIKTITATCKPMIEKGAAVTSLKLVKPI